MSTLDRLEPDKRAIIELVLSRGKSYDEIADLLGMPAARVREHAREALVSLAPTTADRVEPEWRGQLADYVLGQQSGPQSTATRAHLRRSEPARAWALSMLDSLGDLYGDGAQPEIPKAETPRRGGRRKGAAAGGVAEAARERSRAAPTRERRAERADGKPREPAGAADEPSRPLSPAAQAVVRRRRIIAGAAAVVLVAALALVFVFDVFGGDDAQDADTAGGPAQPAQGQARVLSQLELRPIGGGDATGAATIAEEGGQTLLIVQGRLEPTRQDEVYEVWLYNDSDDAQSIGAQITDEQGSYVGAGPLPADFERYEFIDISREETGANPDPEHSGESVLRGRLAGGEPTPEAGGAVPPGTETPTPEGAPTLPEGGGAPPSGAP